MDTIPNPSSDRAGTPAIGAQPDSGSGLAEVWRRPVSSLGPPVVFALLLSLASIVEVFLYIDSAATPGRRTVAIVLNLVVTLAFAFRSWHLSAAAVLATLSTVVLVGFIGVPTVAGVIAELSLLYLVANRGRRRVSAVSGLPFVFLALPIGPAEELPKVILLVLVVFALILGDAQGQRVRAMTERDASRMAMEQSERERVAIEERARIARELHDVVAHHLSMIALQAESASLTTPDLSEEAREKVGAIGATAREALTEMRRLLGVFRTGGDEAPLQPQPGLERLNELLDATRETGTRVTLTLSGRVVLLPQGVDLTAYRIVQEALTNVRRHAEGADVEVELQFTDDLLHLRVRDHGPGLEGGRVLDGHGLHGMRERAAMVGGTLRAGPDPDGGWMVEADLPTSGSR